MRATIALCLGAISVALASPLASCSSSNSPKSAPSTPPFPQVPNRGGPVLTAPEIVTVTFPGDSLASDLESFGQTLESSSYWSTVTGGYCDLDGTCITEASSKNVRLTTAPASSYTDSEMGGSSSLREWLVNAISSGALPAPGASDTSVSNTLYVLYFPTTTTIMLDSLKSCVDYDGYHGSADMGSTQLAYAVVPECSGPEAGNTPPITTLQNTTITASHEIVESTTDPSDNSPAYYLDFTSANLGWMDVEGGGEIADICIDPFLLDQDEVAEGSFTVQRIWSNAHAAAGDDPCNPIPSGKVYFTAYPAQSYFVLDVGSSVTFDVAAYATGAMSDWTVLLQDWTNLATTTTYLDFSIEGGMPLGNAQAIQAGSGKTFSVTMTLKTDPSNSPSGHADGSVVSFSGNVKSPTAAHFWPFAVLTPTEANEAGYDAATSSTKGEGEPPHRTRVRRRRGPLGQKAGQKAAQTAFSLLSRPSSPSSSFASPW